MPLVTLKRSSLSIFVLLFLMFGTCVSWANNAPFIIFTPEKMPPDWRYFAREGASVKESGNGLHLTINKWKKGMDGWPGLTFEGPGLDLSAFSRLILEIENTSSSEQTIAVGARTNSEETVSVAVTLKPETVTKIFLDISDGSPFDQSDVNDILVYAYEPPDTIECVIKSISAVLNPDFVSRRAALEGQLKEAEKNLARLRKAIGSLPNRQEDLIEMESIIHQAKTNYEKAPRGYVKSVEMLLRRADASIAQTGMELRNTDLFIWSSPLGLAIRKGTLPSPEAEPLPKIDEIICPNQYRAVCVNFSAAAEPQKLTVRLRQPEAQNVGISLRPTLFVTARDKSLTADAIAGSQNEWEVEIDRFETQQVLVWINTKDGGLGVGTHTAILEVAKAGDPEITLIPLGVEVVDVPLSAELPFSLSNWAYFFIGSTPNTMGLETEVMENLRDYGANTWNLDYSQVPTPLVNADGGYEGLEPSALAVFRTVFSLLAGKPDELFVVWLGFQRDDLRENLRKPGILKAYLADLHALLDEYQIPLSKRYLMLWDEPRVPQMRETIEWMAKIREIDPSFKFYENGSFVLSDEGELQQYLDLVDRWFPNWDQLFVLRPEDAKRTEKLNIEHMGFYRCLMSRNNRGVNIYEYYRLMSWYLMERGFDTLCFWVHNVGSEDAWDGTTGTSSGGIVVYSKDGKLLSSRRWEIFREGLEDYKVAQAAIGTDGVINAADYPKLLEICRSVVDHPDDLGSADKARRELIRMALERTAPQTVN